MNTISLIRKIPDIHSTWNITQRFLQSAPSRNATGSTKHLEESDVAMSLEENPYKSETKRCILCEMNIQPDYKNVRLLSQFQSRFTGRIYSRHITGLCKAKQEKVEKEILKAQSAGLMGYYTKDMEFVNDPPLFDPNHPFRAHKY